MKLKVVKAWGISYKSGNLVELFGGYLFYKTRDLARTRLRGSPIMLDKCKIVRVEIPEVLNDRK